MLTGGLSHDFWGFNMFQPSMVVGDFFHPQYVLKTENHGKHGRFTLIFPYTKPTQMRQFPTFMNLIPKDWLEPNSKAVLSDGVVYQTSYQMECKPCPQLIFECSPTSKPQTHSPSHSRFSNIAKVCDRESTPSTNCELREGALGFQRLPIEVSGGQGQGEGTTTPGSMATS